MRSETLPERRTASTAVCAIGLLALAAVLPLHGQTQEEPSPSPVTYGTVAAETELRVMGTSTLHDWTVTTEQIKGHITLDPAAGPARRLQAVSVMIPAGSLKSDHKKMNKKMYETLETDKHPNVTYTLSSAEPAKAPDEGATQLATTGMLTLHGTKKTITMPLRVESLSESKLKLSGEYTLDMTDYGMKPPKAMLGAIRVGPEVTVAFDWVVEAE